MKKLFIALSLFLTFLSFTTLAFAHVTVSPKEVGIGQRVNFSVSVPTEGDVPTTQVRLVIPEGLESVRPNVKPGWNIEIKSEAIGMKGDVLNTGEEAPRKVTEIIWSGGSIPAEQRDEFIFSAQAPADETKLVWKAYQTYEDGTVVSWDADPKEISEHTSHTEGSEEAAPKPYSETAIVNDLSAETANEEGGVAKGSSKNDLPMVVGIIALIMAAVSLWMHIKKK